jgi:hypothetical protein
VFSVGTASRLHNEDLRQLRKSKGVSRDVSRTLLKRNGAIAEFTVHMSSALADVTKRPELRKLQNLHC